MIFRRLETAGRDLEQEHHLRSEILRIPLGMTLSFTEEQRLAELEDFHFGMFSSDGQLHACAIATPLGQNRYQIRQMAVDLPHQGQGLGRDLMIQLEAAMRDQGAVELTLHARDIAVGFYARLGYEAVGDPFIEVGIPHQSMRKLI